MIPAPPSPSSFKASGPLRGDVTVPGDKSISHRALMLAALSVGRSRISGLSQGSDVFSTANALTAMGVGIHQGEGGAWEVDGVGTGGLLQPRQALDMGNSGTSARLLMGLAATHRVQATFVGDASLSGRPMDRVIVPLRRMGAEIMASAGDRLPLTVRGMCPAFPVSYRLEVASAQVKSALLLAALNVPGETVVLEPVATRDHSERMLKLFGADIEWNGVEIRLRGEAELRPQELTVPADPSSAAFLIVAALIVPGSEIRIPDVCVNPMRTGLYEVLRGMGGDIVFENERMVSGEPIADMTARHSTLRGVDVPPELVPAMIDEFPVFAIAAAFADGTSKASGLSELRIKESDRISATVAGLNAIGAKAEESGEGMVILGSGGAKLQGGAMIRSRLDHRIAMSFAVAGLHCNEPVTIDDMTPAQTSFPGFAAALEALRT